MAKQKVVLILGLSRIGSTVLDLALGSQENLVGLGEIYEVLRPEWQQYHSEMNCTCGKSSYSCDYWNPVCSWLKTHEQLPIAEKYMHCISAFTKQFSHKNVLIDSSKSIASVAILSNLSEVDLKVIYLIRDVRPWIISKLDDRKNNPDKFEKNGFYVKNLNYNLGFKAKILTCFIPWLSTRTLFYVFAWYFQNQQIQKRLKTMNIPFFQLSYENFALNPEHQLQHLLEFIHDKPITNVNINLNNSLSHIINGNPKRNDQQRKARIFYDFRWFKRFEWLWPYALIPGLKAYNHTQIYEKNGIQNKI